MALDYCRIRHDNEKRYGTDIARIGKLLFTDTYADRTHFIFELLQNAEDAIGRRDSKRNGSRKVSFELTKEQLRFSHSGDPFNEDDVRGICGIGQSTKTENLTEIGHFGIGFKSVYRFTKRPEIHSGPKPFAIDSFVWPVAVPPIDDKDPEETVFLLPFKPDDKSAYHDIASGLQGLGAKALLFLRHIEEVCWRAEPGGSGHYLREECPIDDSVRRVTVIGQVAGEDEVNEEEWLIFSHQVTKDGCPAGNVEIAFSELENQRIQRVDTSPLVAFFPTEHKTHLGFLMQGPFRTTPNRENLPHHDDWNRHLVHETASLLIKSLRWLRDNYPLDTAVLRCLPLNSKDFDEGSLFNPLFEATTKALRSEPLLPRLDEGYVPASRALLGRTAELRDLFSPDQLSDLYGGEHKLYWLSGEITSDREPELRNYLMWELDVDEVTPESIVPRLNKGFLQSQSDGWILRLYEFLKGQTARRNRLYAVPLIRLEDGKHVTPKANGRPRAFLPSGNKTSFPTVAASVCATDDAREFLRSLGLKEPDLVDDVVRNVLPKYRSDQVGDIDYEADIELILSAFDTGSYAQRDQLIDALCQTPLVRAVDAGTGEEQFVLPDEVYLATERLKELFDGVDGVVLVDDTHKCLSGQRICALLEKCGTTPYLKRVEHDSEHRFTWIELKDMRRTAGCEDYTNRSESFQDQTLRGLDPLLDLLPQLDSELRSKKTELLWESLIELEGRRGSSVFFGEYKWRRFKSYYAPFPAVFVQELNETKWVPNSKGDLQRPATVLFDDLGWERNPFLQSKISFMPPPKEEELARELDIDPQIINFLKEHKPTLDELQSWLPEKDGAHTESNAGPPDSTPAPSAASGTRRLEPGHSQDGGRPATETLAGEIESQPEPPTSHHPPVEAAEPVMPFAKKLFKVLTPTPSTAPESPTWINEGGPKTEDSAEEDTRQSTQSGRAGAQVRKSVTRWEPTEAAKELADKFKSMTKNDYANRCQICGTTFEMRNRELQLFVVHLVEPSKDSRTNHLGNLLGLCGWHYALVQYGELALLDPEINQPIEDWERMKEVFLDASEKFDDVGYRYRSIPVRFSNIYQDWESTPVAVNEEIRYSIPHWTYLCELLET